MISVLGIDPGVSGGFAIVSDNGAATAWKMPDTERDVWESIRHAVGEYDVRMAFIEKVGASPQMGVVSAFTFGRGLGALRMALVAREVAFEAVSPGVWQRSLGCLTKGDKNVSKRKAQELYPTLKVTHAVADALLIATWGMRRINETSRQPVEVSGSLAE